MKPTISDKGLESLAKKRVVQRVMARTRLPIRQLEQMIEHLDAALADNLKAIMPRLVDLGRIATRRTELQVTIDAKRAVAKTRAKKAKRKAKRSRK